MAKRKQCIRRGMILLILSSFFSSTSASAWNEWTYIVQPNDQIGYVCERFLGSAWGYFDDIRRLNPHVAARDWNLRWIYPGEPLILPEGRLRREQRERQEAEARQREAQRQAEAARQKAAAEAAQRQKEARLVALKEQDLQARKEYERLVQQYYGEFAPHTLHQGLLDELNHLKGMEELSSAFVPQEGDQQEIEGLDQALAEETERKEQISEELTEGERGNVLLKEQILLLSQESQDLVSQLNHV